MSKDLQFVTDADGHKTAVILPLEEYEELLEELRLSEAYQASKTDERRPFSTLLQEMRDAGEIDV
jgi:PHD/YefM family antitoxin component YafN of YafNO toxin-antitoxin module